MGEICPLGGFTSRSHETRLRIESDCPVRIFSIGSKDYQCVAAFMLLGAGNGRLLIVSGVIIIETEVLAFSAIFSKISLMAISKYIFS